MTERIIPCDGCGRDFSEAYLSDVIGAGGVILHDRNGFCVTCAPHRPARGPRSTYSPENELDYQRRMALAYQAEARDLRAALAERDAKIRELVADVETRSADAKIQRARAGMNEVREFFYGKADGLDWVWRRLRELGLITEEPK